MIVDASALLAVILREPDGDLHARAIADELEDLIMSPVNYVEAAVQADKLGPRTAAAFDEIIALNSIKIACVTKDQTQLAREAYRSYGKGNQKARLNLGDCFAYALSKARGEPLLLKGDDFSKTDVEAAI